MNNYRLILSLFILVLGSITMAKNPISSCPDKPNCVCSTDSTAYAKISPLPYQGSIEKTKETIIKIMNSMERTEMKKNEGPYLHFTTKTRLLRFTDDIEFFIDEENKATQVKSASRTGHSDFSVNRKRVEHIRAEWQKHSQ